MNDAMGPKPPLALVAGSGGFMTSLMPVEAKQTKILERVGLIQGFLEA